MRWCLWALRSLVFDLVDVDAGITNDALQQFGVRETPAGLEFPLGITTVKWTATDQSNNTSEAVEQLINVKLAGTNTAPVAAAQSGI